MIEWIALAVATLSPLASFYAARTGADAQVTISRESLDEQKRQFAIEREDREKERLADPTKMRIDLLYDIRILSQELDALVLEVDANAPIVGTDLSQISAMVANSIHGDDVIDESQILERLNLIAESLDWWARVDSVNGLPAVLLRTHGDDELTTIVLNLMDGHQKIRGMVRASNRDQRATIKQNVFDHLGAARLQLHSVLRSSPSWGKPGSE